MRIFNSVGRVLFGLCTVFSTPSYLKPSAYALLLMNETIFHTHAGTNTIKKYTIYSQILCS